MKTQLLLLLVVCIGFSCGSTNTPQCGTIYDGLTSGKFDIQYQSSRTTVGANWFDFGPNILAYEWAIFSDSFESSIQRKLKKQKQQIEKGINKRFNFNFFFFFTIRFNRLRSSNTNYTRYSNLDKCTKKYTCCKYKIEFKRRSQILYSSSCYS